MDIEAIKEVLVQAMNKFSNNLNLNICTTKI